MSRIKVYDLQSGTWKLRYDQYEQYRESCLKTMNCRQQKLKILIKLPFIKNNILQNVRRVVSEEAPLHN